MPTRPQDHGSHPAESNESTVDLPVEATTYSDKERRNPLAWTDHRDVVVQRLLLLYDDLLALDLQIEALRPQLLEAQPFGAQRLDLRWWLMGAERAGRIDPIPVYYMPAPAHSARRWNVVRLDRGTDTAVRLQDKLRVVGGFTSAKPRYRAYRLATKLQAMLDDRTERLSRLTAISKLTGKSAQPARRRAALTTLNLVSESPDETNPLRANHDE